MTQSIVAVNRLLCADATAFVRQAEADYARQLSDIADYIAAHRDCDGASGAVEDSEFVETV